MPWGSMELVKLFNRFVAIWLFVSSDDHIN